MEDATAHVDSIVADAIDRGASDIHFVPVAGGLSVQLRIKGEVETTELLIPIDAAGTVVAALKGLAGISADAGPVSNGVAMRPFGGMSVVLNVSTFPTHRGESVSIRLGRTAALPSLDDLDLDPDLVTRARSALTFRPHGVVLTTGGAGSGKSTTIHMFMAEARRPGQRVMTVEDQLSFEIPDVLQSTTSEGFGIAQALRAMTGADCDIALAGQLQTSEEMTAAFDLARNGTMVFSVLDAPDAPGALHRLINGGVDPSLVCSLLNLVMGQRLLGKSCPDCQRWRPATEEEIERLDLPASGVEVVASEGCESCDGRGSKGRMIVTELVTMSPPLAAALEQGADVQSIREALGADFVSIEDGIRKHVRAGAVPVDVAMNHVGRRPELTGSLQAVASAATRDTQLS
ncbi:MAG TPA: ATPase, T2SS/T4P/T4SS family, partial [Acidimicrobiales bacterium]|nr:ATPase, T2SS/T4P/T4SS family [Acidimicrobiales bacterium]